MKIVWILAVVLVGLLHPETALAFDIEYYTYGGFDAVYTAYNLVSLIFGHPGYAAIAASAALLGFTAVSFSLPMQAMNGGRPNAGVWLYTALFGMVLYAAFIIPKGNVTIMDPVKNRFQVVGNIPVGVMLIAGSLNLIERQFVDIVDSTGDPVGFKENAGAVGFDMLLGMDSKGVLLTDPYLHSSLKRYIQDCVFFEMQRPGTTLTPALIDSNTDFPALFSLAASPAVYTVFYSDAHPEGETLSCEMADNSISTTINTASTFDPAINEHCAEAGFDPTSPTERVQCTKAITSPINWMQGASYSVTTVFRQTLLAQSLADAVTSGSPDTVAQIAAARQAGTSMMAGGTTANQYVPIIKTVLTAVAVCMVPLMAILVPTPIFKKAILFVVGLFLLLTIWGVVDAILHRFAMNYAQSVFYDVSRYQLGFRAIMQFGTASLKTLGVVSNIRWAGLMVSSAIAGSLVVFGGGYAMTHLAGGATSGAQGAGEHASRTITPEGQAHTVGSLEYAPSVMANASKFDFQQRADSQTYERMTKTQTALGSTQHLGGGGVDAAADRVAAANVTDVAGRVGSAEGRGGPGYSESRGRQQGQQDRGAFSQDNRMAEGLGISQEELGAFRQHGVITDKMAPAIGKSLGLSAGQSRKQLTGMQVNPGQISVSQDGKGLMIAGGQLQNKDGSKTLGSGMITQSGTRTGKQLLDEAATFDKLGHPETAAGLRAMVSPKVKGSDGKRGTAVQGRGLRADEVTAFTKKESYDGKFGTMDFEHGSSVSWRDTTSDKQGRFVDNYSMSKKTDPKTGELLTTISDPGTGKVISKTGESTKDGVKTTTVYDASNPDKVAYQQQEFVKDGAKHFTVKDGKGETVADSTQYGTNLGDANSVRQMATNRKEALYSPIYDAKTDQERDTAFKTVATAMARAEQTIYTGQARDEHSSAAGASASVSVQSPKGWFPIGASAGAIGNVGVSSSSYSIYENQTKEIEDKLRSTYSSGRSLKNAGAQIDEKSYMASEMGRFTEARLKDASQKAGELHGAGKPLELAKKAIAPSGPRDLQSLERNEQSGPAHSVARPRRDDARSVAPQGPQSNEKSNKK